MYAHLVLSYLPYLPRLQHLRLQEVAAACRLPCMYLVDSGGANLPRQVSQSALPCTGHTAALQARYVDPAEAGMGGQG
jgi:acetyl-CoA carboxylase carboxyltransferase component